MPFSRTLMRTTWLAALAAMACAPVAAAESRAATDTERAAFSAFYRAQFPGARDVAPSFIIERDNDRQPWRLGARVDAKPRRAARALCRMDRMRFVHVGEWAMDQPTRLAWLDRGSCGAPPATAVLLLERMPDTDVVALLEQHANVLSRARLLFAGNTSCAVQRSLRFGLHAIDVGSAVPGGEEMAELVFRSDRNTSATVWVRRTGLAYDPWNVSCN